MAKIIKKNIRWSASSSSDVKNYKVYWTTEDNVPLSYDSENITLASTKNSLILPDEVPTFPSEVEANFIFGISAVDDVGNESDIALSPIVAIDFLAPNPPSSVVVETV